MCTLCFSQSFLMSRSFFFFIVAFCTRTPGLTCRCAIVHVLHYEQAHITCDTRIPNTSYGGERNAQIVLTGYRTNKRKTKRKTVYFIIRYEYGIPNSVNRTFQWADMNGSGGVGYSAQYGCIATTRFVRECTYDPFKTKIRFSTAPCGKTPVAIASL